jgi:hypothetical protein
MILYYRTYVYGQTPIQKNPARNVVSCAIATAAMRHRARVGGPAV